MKKGYRFETMECPYCATYMLSVNWYMRHLRLYHPSELD